MDTRAFDRLGKAKYVGLTTFRKNGEEVSTPIWIAPGPGKAGVLYAFTAASTGKVKRIRNNPCVRIAPSDFRGKPKGPAVEAVARFVPESEEGMADRALNAKYPIAKRLLGLLRPFRSSYSRVYLEFRPAAGQEASRSA